MPQICITSWRVCNYRLTYRSGEPSTQWVPLKVGTAVSHPDLNVLQWLVTCSKISKALEKRPIMIDLKHIGDEKNLKERVHLGDLDIDSTTLKLILHK